MIHIQEHLLKDIARLSYGAIDDTAIADLLVQSIGSSTNGKPFLDATLRKSFKKLARKEVVNTEDLIDTLTLITQGKTLESDFLDNRFFFALKLLKLTGLDSSDEPRKELHEQVIWRRCFLQDDWSLLNHTEKKVDELVLAEMAETALFKTLKAGFEDGK